ncbi:MAG: beta-ketoacyl-[acyl-carrier-protein] synthase family protein, partial [Phycisphaerales bacterium]|nr:beta-ketoacyl-[acyl-carrier-protein] synthase family protein [Phycisphaerales bacterium]
MGNHTSKLPDDQRVVVTGAGWVTPLGNDIDSVWDRLLNGESAVAPITHFDASTFATNFAAEVTEFNLSDFFDDQGVHHTAGLSTQYALAACHNAFKAANLDTNPVDPTRIGIYLGAGEGVLDYEPYMAANVAAWDHDARAFDSKTWAEHAYKGMTPAPELEQEPQLTALHLAKRFNAQGPNLNCMTACAASTQAIGEAAELIRQGEADIMIAGGCHAMIHTLGITGFIRLTAMSTRRDDPASASRPFDVTRNGFVMGEGAGIVILESLASAKARGANILAEVSGFGSTADAYRITDIHPDGQGGAGAMQMALDQAGINPADLDDNGRPLVHWVNAHGTSTQENDKTESNAVRSVFKDNAMNIPFSSVKSMLGHLIQAAGAVEFITCLKAIETGHFLSSTATLVH